MDCRVLSFFLANVSGTFTVISFIFRISSMDNYSTNLIGLVKAAGIEKTSSFIRNIGRLISRLGKGRNADNIMRVDKNTAARELKDIMPDLRGATQVKIPSPDLNVWIPDLPQDKIQNLLQAKQVKSKESLRNLLRNSKLGLHEPTARWYSPSSDVASRYARSYPSKNSSPYSNDWLPDLSQAKQVKLPRPNNLNDWNSGRSIDL